MNKQEFVESVNKLRLANKGKWYFGRYMVDGNIEVDIKGYNTWLQIFRVNGINQNTIMDISVKEFKQTLMNGV